MFTQLSSLMIQVLAYFFTPNKCCFMLPWKLTRCWVCHNNNLSTNHPCFATNSHTVEVNVNAKVLEQQES